MAKPEKKAATGDVEMGHRIAEAREQRGLTQIHFAEAMGVSQSAVTQWENGVAMPGLQRFDQMARVLGKQKAWIIGGSIVPNATPAPLAPAPQNPTKWPLDVPVLGTAWGGAMDQFVVAGGILHYTTRPPALQNRKNIFAVYVNGTSMAPWKEPGDLAYVDRDRPPAIGDYVLVELKPTGPDGDPEHGALIKKLLKVNSEFVTLGQFDPPRDDIKVMRAEIAAIYRVLRERDLMGEG